MGIRLSAAFVVVGLVAGQQDQRPRLRSGVELVAVDLQVVDGKGNPVTDLRADDFQVEIDGKTRTLASAELIRYDRTAATPASPSGVPADPMTAPSGSPRRMYIVAIDEHSLRIGTARAAMEAARRFIDRLDPDDLVALFAYPTGLVRTDLTTDHAALKAQLAKIRGLWDRPTTQYRLSPAEIVDIASDDAQTLARVLARECGNDVMCRRTLPLEAHSLAAMFEMKVDQSLGGLCGLIDGLKSVPGRKTLVLVSGGLFASDRSGGRVNVSGQITDLGRRAAAANITLYALHMDASFLDAFSADGVVTPTLFRDMNMMQIGLELVAGAAGGEVFRVQTGSGDTVFERVLRETSAHYLLGIEVAEADRDGRTHTIRVRVKRRGATVRHRTMVVIPKQAGVP